MMQTRYLIVGGGVAGTSAAETIRAKDTTSSIHIVSDESYRFYSRIMLSKPSFFLGKIPFDSVFLKTESWAKDNGISCDFGQPVVALDTAKKVVTLRDGKEIAYEKLLLALGSRVRRWTIPGADTPGVLYLRTLDDAKAVIAAVKTSKKAVVIGGGFIGFEMCDMLKLAGLDVTLIIREKYFWEPMVDEASGRMIEAALKKGGINIIYETLVDEVLGNGKVEGVKLNDGRTLPADMIVVGIGNSCQLDWVMKAGIKCNRGILADERLATSAPDVWTAGDVAEYHDVTLDEYIQLGTWVNAQLHGRIAAANMMGDRQTHHQVTFYTAQGMGLAIAFVGDVRTLPDRQVIQRGSPESGGYTRIITLNGEVEGATMVNRTKDMGPIGKLLEQNIDIEPYRRQMSDPNFDLKTILPKTP
jgi:NAD(P)H-nitrite reductase large subunit